MCVKRLLPVLLLTSVLAVWLYACDGSGPVQPANAAETTSQDAPSFAPGAKGKGTGIVGVEWVEGVSTQVTTGQPGRNDVHCSVGKVPITGGYVIVAHTGCPDCTFIVMENRPGIYEGGTKYGWGVSVKRTDPAGYFYLRATALCVDAVVATP